MHLRNVAWAVGGLSLVVLGAVTVVAQGGGMRAKADIKGEGITGTATFREIDARPKGATDAGLHDGPQGRGNHD